MLRRWRRAGVQTRSAVAATVVLALLVATGAAGFVLLLERSLLDALDETTRARAAAISAQVTARSLLDPSPDAIGDELWRAIHAGDRHDGVVQLIGPYGDVRASSDYLGTYDPLTDARPDPWDVTYFEQDLASRGADHTHPFRLAVLGGLEEDVPFAVVVGQRMDGVQETVRSVLLLLAVAVPLLLVAVGAATYVFVGRSLRPVEAIRSAVAGMSQSDLSRRVPVPPAKDAVAALATTMNALLERLETAQRTQRRFVADASHELRSPVAAIRTASEVSLRHPDPDPEQLPLTVLVESQRLERLVDDLLLLARADEHGLHPERHEVDVDDVVDGERRRVAAEASVQVSARIRPARTIGDLHQVSRAMRNLVDNAVQHARTSIALTVRPEDDWAVVDVDDDGPGIPDDDRDRVFDRFVRLDSSRQRGSGGSGLGLAIVREIVDAHGGDVRILDRPGGGTRVRVRWPAAADPATADEDDVEQLAAEPAKQSADAPSADAVAGPAQPPSSARR